MVPVKMRERCLRWPVAVVVTALFIAGCAPSETAKSNLFDLADVEIGDPVAGLKVVDIRAQTADGTPDPTDATVVFEGQVTVTGTVVHHPEDDAFLGNLICMMELDEASERKLPRMRGDQRDVWFCFNNTEEARRALLAQPGTGRATVVIDDYTIQHRPTEVWNSATLVRVVSFDWTRP
ncbi:MAG: hypothetical protein IMW86_03895 [Hydrogenibacillus sp.]|nr:hypothetical protein [Hydrogenibacillus sp.]